TDQTGQVTLSAKMSGGICSLNMASPTSTSPYPSSLHINHVSLHLVGRGSCASTPTAVSVDASAANAYPPSGTAGITYTETNPDTSRPYSTTMSVAVGPVVYPSGQNSHPDVLELGGIVTKGVGQGLAVNWSLFVDPITTTKPFMFEPGALAACADGTAATC